MSQVSTRGQVELGGVTFGHWQDAFANYDATLRDLVEANDCRSVCEVGGGANPALSLDYVTSHKLRYCLLDVSPTELAKAPAGYDKIAADICGDVSPTGTAFDLVFSKMLAEHIRAPKAFHTNVFRLLRPGGLAFHFFPTLFAFPFVMNLLLPERASTLAQRVFSPRNRVTRGKFPAYYRWCRGPTRSQRRRFETLGYHVEAYVGFFGHGYYRRIPGAQRAHEWLAALLTRRPIPALTSFAYVVLRKPKGEAR